MSEPELAYMTGTNEDFDLPRWHTQSLHDSLSSSAQAAQSAAQASYLYSQGPPPQAANRLPPIHQPPSGSSRQPRINQLLDEDHQFGVNSSPYSAGNLARSLSLGGSTTASSRGRRHHMQDDLEGAFHVDGDTSQRQTPASLYPPSVAYHAAQQGAGGASAADPYQDAYYTGPNGPNLHTPKRSQTQHESSSSRAPRSPRQPPSNSFLDPYSPQQYNSASSNNYPYSPTTEQRSFQGTGYQSQSHSRSQSQTKPEPMSPSLGPSAYSPQSTGNTPLYSGPYPMDTTSPAPSSNNLSAAQRHPRQTSISQPTTPLSFTHAPPVPGSTQYFAQEHQPMAVEPPPPKRRPSGLRRVHDQRDLRPFVNPSPAGRRVDASGTPISPLKQLTTNIIETYHICNPQFKYESTHNPRRVLTKPSKPMHNEGYDNEDYDYILYVNDWLGQDDGHKYLILDILGQGTFGQVVKCQNMKTHEVVAVKVVKNKPAYFNQSMMEVTILELLNQQCDPHDEHHILRLRDSFIHKNHLCLVFELLSSNLYELIKQNQFQGLSTQLVKVFTAQLLDALTVLKEARLIHCDLKPENILLKSLQSPQIKVIDFGSACHERQTVYTYIQSRFYRSPEVLLGIPYTAAIDMWSLGCIAVELFLGLPLFPGTSEYNQITRIVEMLGMPPQYMLDMGKQTGQFFDSYPDHHGQKRYRLKSIEQYSREHNTNEQPGKQYFKATSLPEIIKQAPMPNFKASQKQQSEIEKEMNNRMAFIDFCQGLLNMNPIERWSPQQARLHPFITGEKWTKPWTPTGAASSQSSSPSGQSSSGGSGGSAVDPKRPYGGLVPSQPKGTRAYHDAAAYNQHLAQHQAYTAQAQAASQAAQNVYRNPYLQPQTSQSQSTSYGSGSQDAAGPNFPAPQQFPPASQTSSHRTLTHQSSHGHLNVSTNPSTFYPSQSTAGPGPGPGPGGFAVPPHMNPAAPGQSYYSSARTRSNTIHNMADNIPPALARLQHMNQDVIGGRKALTPVLKRDDPLKEWERRQQGKAAAAATQSYPHLEQLQQQAELAAAQGLTNWGHGGPGRYHPPSGLAHSYQPNAMLVDEDRRDVILSNARNAAHGAGGTDPASNLFASSSANIIPSPPQAYASNSTTTGNRYAATYSQQSQQSAAAASANSPFDGTIDRRGELGVMYVPLQPDQYGPYNPGSNAGAGTAPRQVVPPQQAVPTSFYGAGVVPAGHALGNAQQRNPFTGVDGQPQPNAKDQRRKSGMELWTQ